MVAVVHVAPERRHHHDRCSKDDDGEIPAELGDAVPLSKRLQNEGGELGD